MASTTDQDRDRYQDRGRYQDRDQERRIPGLTPTEIKNPYGFGLPPSLIAKDDFHEKVWHKWMEPIEVEKTLGLPTIKELPISVFQQYLVPDPSRLAEACVAKVVISTLMGTSTPPASLSLTIQTKQSQQTGGVLGMGFGVVMSAFEGMSPPVVLPGQPEPPKKTWKQELRDSARKTRAKSRSWGKNFAALTAMFQGFECAIEKTRGTHDIYNSMSAGCLTGAALAHKSGPQAMGIGCVGFAAFSAVIDTVMGTH